MHCHVDGKQTQSGRSVDSVAKSRKAKKQCASEKRGESAQGERACQTVNEMRE